MVILNRLLKFILLVLLASCMHPQTHDVIVPSALDGQWFYAVGEHEPERIPTQAKTIQVPSNWWQEGVEVSGVVWFYRYVNLETKAKQFKLHFNGVDYQADVFWDGRYLGQHQGYFSPFSFLLKENVSTQKQHLMAVRVDSPKEDKVHWHQHKRLIKGVLSHHDTRPDGAWGALGQKVNTGGIWGSVWLEPVHGTEVHTAKITTVKLEQGLAQLKLELEMTNMHHPVQLHIEVQSPDGSIVYRRSWSSQHATHIQDHFSIENPMLWASWDRGEANLYRLQVDIQEGDSLRKYTQKFGVRTIERDGQGRWLLNGQPIFLRGTNHIPSLFLANLTQATLRHDLQLMKEANINAVRVHAHITHPMFYDLADEMGMMVWQDFPLQWGYADQASVHQSIMLQLKDMVDLLAHHPSIIFWNGHNEAPWSATWMQEKYPKYDKNQNKQLDQDIALSLRELDDSRPSQGNSTSEEHLWFGWYSDSYKKFMEPQRVTTVSELGAQAVPNVTTLRTFLKKNQLWPMNATNAEIWRYRNFQQHELTVNASVSMGGSVEELVENSQLYQAHLLQFSIENLRLQAWKPITGVFQFMFAEHWPSIGWGVLDYQREQKKGYQALQQAYQQILPVATCEQQADKWQCTFSVINDTDQYYSHVKLEVTDGQNVLTSSVQIERQSVTHFSMSYPISGQNMRLQLRDAAGNVLAANTYTNAYFKALKQL